MDKYPLVTIGVSAYNRKVYLQECLDSLLVQSYPACEIIVIDDGSTDGTGAMMQEKYPQIKYVYQENAGDSAAKDHAARIGTGEYIVFNDSDDIFLPDAVERLMNALPENDKNAVAYGTYITIDASGTPLPTKRKTATYPSGHITGELLQHILVNCTATLMPRELYLANGGLGPVRRVASDYAFYLELSLKSSFHAVQEPVFLRRRHGDNLSNASYDKILTVYNIFEDFIARHPELYRKYKTTIRRRRGDFHNKLYREARREKLADKMRLHARAAFRYTPGIKTFTRILASIL